jgi:hypothetical protein
MAALAILTSTDTDLYLGFVAATIALGFVFRFLVMSKRLGLVACGLVGIATSAMMRLWYPSDVARSWSAEINSVLLYIAAFWAGSLLADQLRSLRIFARTVRG